MRRTCECVSNQRTALSQGLDYRLRADAVVLTWRVCCESIGSLCGVVRPVPLAEAAPDSASMTSCVPLRDARLSPSCCCCARARPLAAQTPLALARRRAATTKLQLSARASGALHSLPHASTEQHPHCMCLNTLPARFQPPRAQPPSPRTNEPA